MTKWLEVAQKYDGLKEVAGPKANPTIMGWYAASKGSWVKDDATPWCGAFCGGVLTEAGHASALPSEPLRARSWLQSGYKLDEPRVGAIVVFPRGKNPAQGHVGLVKQFDASTLWVLGGNQSNKVCVQKFSRSSALGYRWPVPIMTPKTMPDESRIAKAATRQQKDKLKAGGVTASTPAPDIIPAPPKGWRDVLDGWMAEVSWAKQFMGYGADFGGFVGANWWWIAGGIALYFLARTYWDSHLIRIFRTEDHNGGWST